jgi:hypothetical protein
MMVHEWTATRDTLHMWAEIVGKIRMVRMPGIVKLLGMLVAQSM